MIEQSEQEKLQPLNSAEVREHLLAEIDASQQSFQDLSDEELEAISGGAAANAPKWAQYAFKTVEKAAYYGSKVGRVFRR